MNKRFIALSLLALFLALLTGWHMNAGSQQTKPNSNLLVIFAGSASKPPLDEVIASFTKETGIQVQTNYGGSGTMLSQMLLAKQGDLYIPGSQDFMDKAEEKDAVKKETRKILAYLVPSIVVPKGNPKGIQKLSDLGKPGVKVGIADPQTVCLGAFAEEIFAKAGVYEKIKPNIIVTPKSCEDIATVAALGQVDAVIGWTVFGNWNPDKLEVVKLPPDQLVKISNIPVAISKFCQQPETAQKFIDYLTSPKGKEIFRRYGYPIEEVKI